MPLGGSDEQSRLGLDRLRWCVRRDAHACVRWRLAGRKVAEVSSAASVRVIVAEGYEDSPALALAGDKGLRHPELQVRLYTS